MNPVPRVDQGTTIHQLREPVPVHLQGLFFAQVRGRRQEILAGKAKQPSEESLLRRVEQVLFDERVEDSERLMLYFTRLACCDSIEALRFAEGLIARLDEGVARHLALMTELELRMQVYEDLTEQPQALIASGLGGEGELIRLNGIAIQVDFKPWEPYQRELLHNELSLICEAQGGYIEEELWGEEYYGFRLMLPYYIDIAEQVELFLNTCNEYGRFIHPDCHVTNMILLTHEDIQTVVNLRKQKGVGTVLNIDAMLNQILGNPDDADNADREIRGDDN